MKHASLGSILPTLVLLLSVSCAGPADDLSDSSAHPVLRSVARPEGWHAESHERRPGDYERVFDPWRVHRLDIVIPPEQYQRMVADLTARIGTSPRTARSPDAVAACAGRAANDPCGFLDVAGLCTPAGAILACEADDQIGPLDLVPGDPIAVPVTVHYGDIAWHHVAMRFKGNSSLSSPFRSGRRKLPFRLDFDGFETDHPTIDDQRFFGFEKLTFASGYSDASLVREAASAEVLREAGLKVARTAFYRVFVDAGEGPTYWGLYTMVEDPADQLLSAQFGDASGNLYKPDGPGADFTQFERKSFEKKTNEAEEDYGDIHRALAALHTPRTDAAAWRRGLEATFDVDSFLRTLAATRAIDHWDGYGQNAHNYYLYGDPAEGGRLVWISWDHNLTFAPGRGRSSLYLERTSERWPLLHFLLGDVVYRARYITFLEEVLTGPLEKTRFDAMVSALHERIAPYVVGPEGERPPYSNLRDGPAFMAALPALIAAGDARRTVIGQALAAEAARQSAAAVPGATTDSDPQLDAPAGEESSEGSSADDAHSAPGS